MKITKKADKFQRSKFMKNIYTKNYLFMNKIFVTTRRSHLSHIYGPNGNPSARH